MPVQPTQQTVYRDFDLDFKMHPMTNTLITRKNADSVKQGIKNLILTNFYERPFRHNFGSNIRRRLFENFDASIVEDITHDVTLAFKNYSKRAELVNVGVLADPDNNSVSITISFRPINSTAVQQVTINIGALR